MGHESSIGELEQLVLLAILRQRNRGYALEVLAELESRAGRRVTRGTLYKALDRLEAKGYVDWEVEEAGPERGGHPRRRFRVTPEGVEVLQSTRAALYRMWDGLEGMLGKRPG